MKFSLRNIFPTLFAPESKKEEADDEVKKYLVKLHLGYTANAGPSQIVSTLTAFDRSQHEKNIDALKSELNAILTKVSSPDEYINLNGSLVIKRVKFLEAYITTSVPD